MKFNTGKIKSYVGFAIKSRNICFGTDEILKSKDTQIIFISNALSDNSKSKLINFAYDRKVDLFEFSDEEIEQMILNKSVKAFAITDKNLARAIKDYINK